MSNQVADLLDAAAEWLDQHQLIKHNLWNTCNITPTAACARGALLEVAGLREEVVNGYRMAAFQNPLFKQADTALSEVVGNYVPAWNNKLERTKEDVVKAMRQAADNVRFSHE